MTTGVVLAGLFALAQPATAEQRQLTYRYGPIELGPFEVKQDDASYSIPKPDVDGFVWGWRPTWWTPRTGRCRARGPCSTTRSS